MAPEALAIVFGDFFLKQPACAARVFAIIAVNPGKALIQEQGVKGFIAGEKHQSHFAAVLVRAHDLDLHFLE